MDSDLHIGTAKSGTTSIQSFLEKNKNELSKQNILYPSSLKLFPTGNHRLISWYVCNENNLKKELFMYKKHKRQIFCEALDILYLELKEFENELKNFKEQKCIISSEDLSSYGLENKNVNKIKAVLGNFFRKIRIILYIRRPIDRGISALNTRIIAGDSFDKPVIPENLSPNRLIKVWSEIFGAENIIVRLFNKNDYIDNDLISDFCSQTEIDLNNNFVFPDIENESLNLIQLKYLNFLNKKIPRFINNEKKINPNSYAIKNLIKKNFKSPLKYLPTKEEFQRLEIKNEQNDDWIRQKFFPHKSSLWGNYEKGFRDNSNELIDLSKEELMLLDSIVFLFNNSLIKNSEIKKLF